LSHELRTPLNAVIGYAEMLDLGVAGGLLPGQRQQVARIRGSARHLLGLVDEILDLSKVEAGRLSVQHGVARVANSVDAAIGLILPSAESKGITVDGPCDGRAGTAMYEGDEDRVRQILVNLFSNAVKFTPAGGRVAVECDVVLRADPDARVRGEGSCVAVRVTDTGIGIPADRMSAIFDPFVQVEEGHTRSSDGSGLGLTISRRLARLMGGDLTVRSEIGKGSSFTLWLREAGSDKEVDRGRAEPGDTLPRLKGLADVGDILLRELQPVVQGFVARLRAEEIAPGAASLRTSQLADHAAAYVADLAALLWAIDEARGQPSALVADGADIHTLVAERHGAQRARLGWTTTALEREWALLREEIERVVRRSAGAVPESSIDEALVVIERFIEQAERTSLRVLARISRE
jgi:hypothetical protein